MLYDVKFTYFRGLYSRVNYIPLGIFIGFLFLFEILYVGLIDLGFGGFDVLFQDFSKSWADEVSIQSNMQIIAEVLYIISHILFLLQQWFYY